MREQEDDLYQTLCDDQMELFRSNNQLMITQGLLDNINNSIKINVSKIDQICQNIINYEVGETRIDEFQSRVEEEDMIYGEIDKLRSDMCNEIRRKYRNEIKREKILQQLDYFQAEIKFNKEKVDFIASELFSKDKKKVGTLY